MQLEFLFLGKTRESYLAAGIDDFAGRLQHYARVSVKTLKGKRGRAEKSELKEMEAEAEQLLQARTKGSLLVGLERTGNHLKSEELAKLLRDWQQQGIKTVSFMIGGPTGLAPAAIKEADYLLSLSRMTLTHEMTRLVLLEQLYRAYTINAGEKYHR